VAGGWWLVAVGIKVALVVVAGGEAMSGVVVATAGGLVTVGQGVAVKRSWLGGVSGGKGEGIGVGSVGGGAVVPRMQPMAISVWPTSSKVRNNFLTTRCVARSWVKDIEVANCWRGVVQSVYLPDCYYSIANTIAITIGCEGRLACRPDCYSNPCRRNLAAE
jgi:hypothetical protein